MTLRVQSCDVAFLPVAPLPADPPGAERCGCDGAAGPGGMLAVEDAVALALSMVAPVRESEAVGLGHAVGRIAARTLCAPRPMPFFDQSAMDGFAVRLGDLGGEGPWRLDVAGTVAAGDSPAGAALPAGAAWRIFTGAPVPHGADAVVRAEDCSDMGAVVTVRHRPREGANIRPLGSDIARGAELVAGGTRIEPRHVGLLAANGHTALDVVRRPRIGILSTGSELLSRAGPDGGRIFDANRPMLMALAGRAGAEVADLGILDDDRQETARTLARHAGRFDMLISSGAVSVGARDFVRAALLDAGGRVHGWKVALKPGKPALFATLKRTAYLGLPGNPLAAFVGFELFARAQIARLAGAGGEGPVEVRALAGFAASRKPGRTEFVPARVGDRSPEGLPVLETLGSGSSGTLHALCQADGLAVIPAGVSAIAPGDPLGFRAFAPSGTGSGTGDAA